MLSNLSSSSCGTTVSVVIVSYNSEKFIRPCIDALLQSEYPVHEIVVVDNASKDGSASIIERAFPQVRLVKNSHNLGFAGGCNLGISHSSGQIVALVNPDVVVRRTWLGELISVMAKDSSIAIAGCKLFYPDGCTIQHAGGYLRYPLALADHYGYGQPDNGVCNVQRDVEYVTGAALAARREMLERLGGFDERFFPAYFEETDLCWRARKAGFRVVYVPRAVGIHYETTTTGKESENYYYFYHLNRIRFVLKNYDSDQLLNHFFPAELERLKIVSPEAEKRALDKVYREILDPTFLQGYTNGALSAPEAALVKAINQLSKRANKMACRKRWSAGLSIITSRANLARRVAKAIPRVWSKRL